MKKTLVLLLSLFLMLSLPVFLVSCAKKDDSVKLGLGIYSASEGDSSASVIKNGKTTYAHTVAAVLLDREGKILKCKLDVAEVSLSYSADGKYVPESEYKTKGELGDAYNMKKGGAKLEWYEQRDAFCKTVEGKTLSDVKALVVGEGKGNDAVTSAGCTIVIDEFVRAIDKAVNNAKPVGVDTSSAITLSISTTASGKNASESEVGNASAKTVATLSVSGSEEKLSEEASFAVNFDAKGILKPDEEKMTKN